MSAPLAVRGLRVRLGRAVVVDGADLDVAAGEVVGLVGPNGAGKTTLLRAALGLVATPEGTRRLGGHAVETLSVAERARRAGYLPQGRKVAWGLAAWRIAALGAPDVPEPKAKALAFAALAEVGAAGYAHRGMFELSGGEQARVLMARLLVTRAPLLICDEPAGGLDPAAQLAALSLLRRRAAAGGGVLVTLHDLDLALGACDRIVVMDRGRIVADGPPAEALSAERVKAVFGLAAQLLDGPYGPLLALERPSVEHRP